MCEVHQTNNRLLTSEFCLTGWRKEFEQCASYPTPTFQSSYVRLYWYCGLKLCWTCRETSDCRESICFAIYQGSVAELNQLICRSWCCPSSWRCVLSSQNETPLFQTQFLAKKRVASTKHCLTGFWFQNSVWQAEEKSLSHAILIPVTPHQPFKSKLGSSFALVLRHKVAFVLDLPRDFRLWWEYLLCHLSGPQLQNWINWYVAHGVAHHHEDVSFEFPKGSPVCMMQSKKINWQRVKILHDVFQPWYQKANRYMQGNKCSSLSYLLRKRFPMLNFVWCLETRWQSDEIPNAAFPNMLPGNFGTHDDWQSQGTTCLFVRDANQFRTANQNCQLLRAAYVGLPWAGYSSWWALWCLISFQSNQDATQISRTCFLTTFVHVQSVSNPHVKVLAAPMLNVVMPCWQSSWQHLMLNFCDASR